MDTKHGNDTQMDFTRVTLLSMDEITTTYAGIVRSLSDKLRAYYVFPEIAEQICPCLQKHLEDGDYSDITEGDLFALALTMHMQEVNHDEHLWVRWHPEPLPDDEGQLRLNQEWQEAHRLEAGLDNYGFHKVERLPGNVGYLDIRYFHRPGMGRRYRGRRDEFFVQYECTDH